MAGTLRDVQRRAENVSPLMVHRQIKCAALKSMMGRGERNQDGSLDERLRAVIEKII